MEPIHSSRCSKYYPGFSPAYLASIVLALHKTLISKLSFGDIHQLAFRGSIKKERERDIKRSKLCSRRIWLAAFPPDLQSLALEISASEVAELLLSKQPIC